MKRKVIVVVSGLLAVAVTLISIFTFKQDRKVVYARTVGDAYSYGYLLPYPDRGYPFGFFTDLEQFKQQVKQDKRFFVSYAGFMDMMGNQLSLIDYAEMFGLNDCDCGVLFRFERIVWDWKIRKEGLDYIVKYMKAHRAVYNYPVFIVVEDYFNDKTKDEIRDAFWYVYDYLTSEKNGKIYPVFLVEQWETLDGVDLSGLDVNPFYWKNRYDSPKDIVEEMDVVVQPSLLPYSGGNFYVGPTLPESPLLIKGKSIYQVACFKDYPSIIQREGYNGFKKIEGEFSVTCEMSNGIELDDVTNAVDEFDDEIVSVVKEGEKYVINFHGKYCYEPTEAYVRPVDPKFKSNAIIHKTSNQIIIENIDCSYNIMLYSTLKLPVLNF